MESWIFYGSDPFEVTIIIIMIIMKVKENCTVSR
jgi:hypothetical protein